MPPAPGLFGRAGTARALEKDVRTAQKFKDAVESAEAALTKMYVEGEKGSSAQKKAQTEVAAAMALVSKELEGTTKNAQKYEKAVQKDTQAVLEFAKKHKLSLTEAVEMYKKVRKEQGLFGEAMGRITDRLDRLKVLRGS